MASPETIAVLTGKGRNPSFDMNLTTGQLDSRVAFSRSTNAYSFDQTGVLQSQAVNVPRLDYGPTPTISNYVSNSTMQGATIGAGNYPTYWGSFATSGVTVTLVGTGIVNGLNYVDFNFAGTTGQTFGVYVFQNPSIATSPGVVWTQSFYCALTAGSMSGISMTIDNRYSAGPQDQAITPTATLTRFSATSTAPAGTINTFPGWAFSWASGLAINFTLRFAAPQLEMASTASTFVPTFGIPASNQYTNLLTFSDSLSNAAYTQISTIVASSAVSPPISGMSVWHVANTAGSAAHQLAGPSMAFDKNVTYTASGYFKSAEYSAAQINITGSLSQAAATIELSSGATQTFGTGTISASSQNMGSGWWRLALTFLTQSQLTGQLLLLLPLPNTTGGNFPTTTGDGTSGVLMSGFQIERTRFAGSYIKTTNASATIGASPIGLLIEEQRTNGVRNPRAEGALVYALMAAPAAATLDGSVVAGSLAATTYFVKITYVDGANGETLPSTESSLAVVANNVLTVTSPVSSTNAFNYNVYVSTASGTETLQATVAIGTNWVEPATGLVTGAIPPSTATAKTTGTLPTNWSQSQNTNLQPIVLGTGTEVGMPYIDLQYVGTAIAGNCNLVFDVNGVIAASNGQAWTQSVYIRVIGGSMTNVSNITLIVGQRDASNASLGDLITTYSSSAFSNTALTGARYLNKITTNQATIASIRPSIQINPTNGAVNITLRIGIPQLELGPFQTSPILPAVGTPAATTRAGDIAQISTGSWLNPRLGSVCAEFYLNQLDSTTFHDIVGLETDGNNIILLRQTSGTSASFITWVANVSQGSTSVGTLAANTIQKSAFTYTTGTSSLVVNAGAPATTPLSGVPPITLLNLSSPRSGYLDGYIRRIRYWPRLLSTNELQQVTT